MAYDIILGRDASDKKKFGQSGLIHIGKGYVTMGNYTSMSNNIFLDVARSHVILVAGKRGCLEGNTQVFTDKGYKRIKDFNPLLDKVLSFNLENQTFEWERAELIRYYIKDEKLIKIISENNKELILTKEHPLLIATGNKQLSLLWRTGKNLKVGDLLLETVNSFKDINPIKIKEIKEIENIKEVYDLSVPKNHSFIANGIISHNSGKSYTLGVITEEISNLPPETSRNIAPIIFDTMGIFWTMKFKNEKEKSLLDEWKLEPKSSPIKVFAPIGKMQEYRDKGIPVDEAFALKASELESEDWIITFNVLMTSQEGVLITNTISELKKEKDSFTIQDIINQINKTHNISQETKNIANSLFQAAESWGIFATTTEGIEITDLINAGKTTIIDLSVYSSIGSFNVRGLVIGLVSRKIFTQRINARKQEEIQSIQHGIDYMSYNPTRETPLVWLFIDEAHEFLKKNEKTPATDALVQILREGRQPGISLVLATQQPGQIHNDVMTQSDIIISHRVTSKPDIEALNQIMQTYLLESIKSSMDKLPSSKGSAIILDDNSERIYPMRMRPRLTWHGGESPSAVKGQSNI